MGLSAVSYTHLLSTYKLGAFLVATPRGVKNESKKETGCCRNATMDR